MLQDSGYPPDFKSKKRGGAGNGATYNVFGEGVPQNGILTNNMTAGNPNTIGVNQTAGQGQENIMTQLSQLGVSPFTQEQYDQILQLLNKNPAPVSNNTLSSATNVASTSTSTTLLASEDSKKEWIVDT